MPMNIQEMLDKAFEAGRDAERAMAEIVKSVVMHTAAPIATMTAFATLADNGARKRPGRVAKTSTKAVDAPQAPKAPVVARGVKAAPKTREKGVKKAIVELIAAEGVGGGITTAGIIAKLGFKASSVNATLMGLKKANIAMQAGKFWIPAPHSETGNSDDAETYANF